MDFEWIKEIDIIEGPCVIFLRKDRKRTKVNGPALQSFLHQRKYKNHGNNRIFRGEFSGLIIDNGGKKFRILNDYYGHMYARHLVGYNVYYFYDIKNSDYISKEKIRVYRSRWEWFDGSVHYQYFFYKEGDSLYLGTRGEEIFE
jgi:hypothetical protein